MKYSNLNNMNLIDKTSAAFSGSVFVLSLINANQMYGKLDWIVYVSCILAGINLVNCIDTIISKRG